MNIKRLNWKVLIALAALVVAAVWGVNSLRTRSYSGTDLNFGIGGGPVALTNSSDETVPVQLVGTRPGTFSVSGSIEGVAGRSTSQGSGRDTTQLFEFDLPPGVSEITVLRGTGVNLIASSGTSLQATVYPLNAEDSRITLIVMVLVILGSLFYLSSVNGHRWISAARRQKALDQAAAQETERQNFKRIYGRATSDKS